MSANTMIGSRTKAMSPIARSSSPTSNGGPPIGGEWRPRRHTERAAELLSRHFDPGLTGEVGRSVRSASARSAGLGGAAPASSRARGCLPDLPVAVDLQNTFCVPGFELYVQGAERDNARLCEFLYRNLGTITAIIPTLDSHRATQIFHPVWLIDEEAAPGPLHAITAEDARTGRWRINPAGGREHRDRPGIRPAATWTARGSSRRAASTR